MDPIQSEPDPGLIQKFEVKRLVPSKRGIDHVGCKYFVIDITHDPLAKYALLAYAAACEDTQPQLAEDLRNHWPHQR